MNKIQVIDGAEWNTSEYTYKGRRIIIKSAKNKGMRAHCFFENGTVEFTLRYYFIKPESLLQKVKTKIDNLNKLK